MANSTIVPPLRTTNGPIRMVTALNAAGASPKILQKLARHSDIKTALKQYARAQISDTQAALDNLPSLPTYLFFTNSIFRTSGTDVATRALH